ncbi:MAG: hypothetical protein OIF58_05105 [Cohaesibacter sp.]|nr:hypothetical protein [Cohaesibacter sp.]
MKPIEIDTQMLCASEKLSDKHNRSGSDVTVMIDVISIAKHIAKLELQVLELRKQLAAMHFRMPDESASDLHTKEGEENNVLHK